MQYLNAKMNLLLIPIPTICILLIFCLANVKCHCCVLMTFRLQLHSIRYILLRAVTFDKISRIFSCCKLLIHTKSPTRNRFKVPWMLHPINASSTALNKVILSVWLVRTSSVMITSDVCQDLNKSKSPVKQGKVNWL